MPLNSKPAALPANIAAALIIAPITIIVCLLIQQCSLRAVLNLRNKLKIHLPKSPINRAFLSMFFNFIELFNIAIITVIGKASALFLSRNILPFMTAASGGQNRDTYNHPELQKYPEIIPGMVAKSEKQYSEHCPNRRGNEISDLPVG